MDQSRHALSLVIVLAIGLVCIALSAEVSAGSPPEGWYQLPGGSDLPAPPAVVLVTGELAESVVMVDIPGMLLETVSEGGTDYSRVSVPGYGELSEAGFPELPVVPVVLAVPESDSLHVSVTVLDSIELTDILPMSAPEWEVEYTPEGHPFLQAVFAPNQTFYGRTESGPFFPGVPIYGDGRGHLRDQAFSRVELHPFQYEPATGVLKVYTRLRIVVEHAQSRGERTCDVGPFTEMAASTLLGYDRLSEAGGSRGGRDAPGTVVWAADYDACLASSPDYLVIYDDDICPTSADTMTHEGKKWLGRLANKRAWYDGFNVALLPVSGLPGTGARDARIRNTIGDLYGSETAAHMGDGHLGFVLLVGDPQAGQTDVGVPMYDIPHCFGYESEDFGYHTSTDHLYSCVADTDRVSDVAIGRLAPGDADELVTDASKTVRYEPVDPSQVWRSRVYLSSGFDVDHIAGHEGALVQIDSLSAILGRQDEGYLVTAEYCHLLPGDAGHQLIAMRQANVDAFNTGQFVAVFHDHGWAIGHETFRWMETDSLSNSGMPTLFFAQACKSGAVDNTSEFDNHGNTDSLAERLLHLDGSGETGVVAFLGSTENALNKTLATWVVRSIFEQHRPMLGVAVGAAKASLLGAGTWNYYALAVHEYNLTGDPALDLLLAEDDGYATLPDLVTRSGDMEVPRSAGFRDTILLRCEVTNASAADIPPGTSVEVEFVITAKDGQSSFQLRNSTDELAGWGAWTAEVKWGASETDLGDYEVTAVVDPDGTIDEFREENNTSGASLPLSVNFAKVGFPKRLSDGFTFSQLTIAEVDGDSPGDEILLIYRIRDTSMQIVEARTSGGEELWSFSHPGITGIRLAPAVADIDGDGMQEVVVVLHGAEVMSDTCFVLNGRANPGPVPGRVHTRFHVGTGEAVPLVADVNPLDGHPEILLAADDGSGGAVRAWDVAGGPATYDWSYDRGIFIRDGEHPLTLVNFTGSPGEVVTWTSAEDPARLVCVGADGLPDWWDDISGDPIAWPGYGSAAGDLDGDGSLDAVSVLSLMPQLCVHSAETGNVIGSSAAGGVGTDASAVLGDVDGDGELDIVVAGGDRIDVFNASTGLFSTPEWSKTLPDCMMVGTQPLIGDVDGGSDAEIVVATMVSGDHRLWILKPSAVADTLELVTPPIWLPGSYATGAICDLDADGYAEIVFTTDDGSLYNLEYWEQSTGRFDWPMYRHDPQRTGVHSCPVSGTLAESATWVGDVDVTGDVTVQAGNTLHLQPGVRVVCASGCDSESGGADSTLCELVVDGRMDAVGGSGSAATTIESSGSPGSWYGLVFKSGSACSLRTVSIRDAYKSVWATETDPLVLQESVLSNHDLFGVQLTGCDGIARIDSCHISDCVVGVLAAESLVEIAQNTIADVHNYGVKLVDDLGSNVTGNAISLDEESMPAGWCAGIYVLSPESPVATELTGNEVRITDAGSIGIWANSVPDAMSISANVLSGWRSGTGMRLTKASATLRANELSGFSTAYYITKKGYHVVDMGDDVGSPGLNCTDDLSALNIYAFSTTPSVPICAQNNWWGTSSPSESKFSATGVELYWEPYLDVDPRGRGGRPVGSHAGDVLSLAQASPNPFNPTTTIAFGIPEAGDVRVAVYDVAGRCVRELLASRLEAGEHRVVWEGRDDEGHRVASGVYFCRLETGAGTRETKVVLLK